MSDEKDEVTAEVKKPGPVAGPVPRHTMPLSFLRGWDKNPRAIRKDSLERLKRQIKAHGQFKPVIVTADGEVLGGNMRLKAYEALGIADVWVSVVEPKDEAEKVGIALADNDRAGYYVEDDLAELLLTTEGLKLEDYHLDFGKTLSASDFADRFQPTEEDEFDVEEALPAEGDAVTMPGDVYALGTHRLMCGSAESAHEVEDLMAGNTASMVFTDPPYGVSFQSNMRTASEKFDVLKNDDTVLTGWIPNAAQHSSGFMFVWTSWKVMDRWIEALRPVGFPTNVVVWDKGGGIGDLEGTFVTDYEIALVYNRGAKITGKRIGSVWEIGKDSSGSYVHPTQKPIALASQAIRSVTREGESVLDLFGGSGSTLIACEQLGRTCYMMELDPRYCDVIVKRWEQLTGSKAEKIQNKNNNV